MSNLFGRVKIESDVEYIDSSNVVEVLKKANQVHAKNVSDMDYLWNYYTGRQDILDRTKEIRDDILNIVIENRAKEIVDFKSGNLLSEPIVYTSRNNENADDETSAQVAKLNDYMLSEGRLTKDKKVIDYMLIFGTAYKMAVADRDESVYADRQVQPDIAEDHAPFELYAPDPRKAFVIYSTGIGEVPLAGVYRVVDGNQKEHFTVYTEKEWFKVFNNEIVASGVNGIGRIPIVEYPANVARLGAFEPVISMLDAINKIDSNRIDGVEQFIQSLIVLTNCELPEGTTASTLMQNGLVMLKSNGDIKADVKILSEQLDQTQTQTLKDDMYNSVLTICAMPNRQYAGSTADTGVAVMYRDGWSAAETAAQATELMYKESETEFLKVILRICSDLSKLELDISSIDIKFTRHNFEGNEIKANILNTLLSNNKLDPKLAFIYSGLFSDPESAYRASIPYIEKAMSASQTEESVADTQAEKPTNADGREAE